MIRPGSLGSAATVPGAGVTIAEDTTRAEAGPAEDSGVGGTACAVPGEDIVRQALAEAPIAMLLLDRESRIMLANREAGRLLGQTASALVGRASSDVLQAARLAVDANGPTGLVAVPTPLGGAEGGQILLTLFDHAQGRPLEWEAVGRSAIRAERARLAMLARLSAALAHEINQPLAAVVGNGEAALGFLAADPPALVDVGECLADIVASGRRARDIQRRQRSLASEDGAGWQPLVLGEVIGEILPTMRNELINRGLWLAGDVGRPLPQVTGNRVQLQQVLMTLVAKVADDLGPSARGAGIRVSVRPGEERTVVLSVGAESAQVADAAGEGTIAIQRVASDPCPDLEACCVIVEAHGGCLRDMGEAGGLRYEFGLAIIAAPGDLPMAARPAPPRAQPGQ